MKLAILHLSDMHFDANSCNYNNYVEKIVFAIQNVAEVSYVVIVLSGDIAKEFKKIM